MANESWLKLHCVEFADNTTIHGLKQIAGSTGKIYRRVIWLLLLLATLSLLMLYFVNGLMQYIRHPSVTRINVFENKSLPFPTVTICNNNMIRESYMNVHPLVSAVTGMHAPEMNFEPMVNLSDPAVIDDMKTIFYSDIFTEGSHTTRQLFRLCYWEGIEIDCDNELLPVDTDDHGRCYSFNTGGSLISQRAADVFSFEVLIDTQQYQYSHMGILPAAGVKVVIHDSKSSALLSEKAMLLPPGRSTEFALFRREDIFLPSPFEGEGCYDGDDYASLSDCKRLCYSNYITTRCQCHKFSPSGTAEEYRKCTLYDYHSCIVPQTDFYRSNKEFEEECGCLHHCKEVDYDITQSQLTFPSNYAAEYFNDYMGYDFSAEDYRDNLVHMMVYYGDLQITVTEQVEAYSFASFSAEVGGYMGLCIGASLMTLAELLEFVMTLGRQCLCTRRRKTDLVTKMELVTSGKE